MSEVWIKSRATRPLCLHFDPATDEYFLHVSELGACVFTRDNAETCVREVLPGGLDEWSIEALPAGMQVAALFGREADRIRSSLSGYASASSRRSASPAPTSSQNLVQPDDLVTAAE